MTPTTMTEETVAGAMKPLPTPIELRSTAAEARERMIREDLDFLPVVDPEKQTLLGVVLLGALERACQSNGHDPASCPLTLHLKKDVDVCRVGAAVREVFSMGAEGEPGDLVRARKARVRRSLPVIVLDDHRVPVGLLDRR